MESKEVIKHLEERQSLNAKDGTHYKRYAKAIELISQNEELKKTINAEATQIANLSSDLGYFKGKSDGLEQDLKDNYIKKSDITVIAQGDSRRIVLNNETDFEELKKHGYIKKEEWHESYKKFKEQYEFDGRMDTCQEIIKGKQDEWLLGHGYIKIEDIDEIKLAKQIGGTLLHKCTIKTTFTQDDIVAKAIKDKLKDCKKE